MDWVDLGPNIMGPSSLVVPSMGGVSQEILTFELFERFHRGLEDPETAFVVVDDIILELKKLKMKEAAMLQPIQEYIEWCVKTIDGLIEKWEKMEKRMGKKKQVPSSASIAGEEFDVVKRTIKDEEPMVEVEESFETHDEEMTQEEA